MQFGRPGDRAWLLSGDWRPAHSPDPRPAIELWKVSIDRHGLVLNVSQPECRQAEPFQSGESGHIQC